MRLTKINFFLGLSLIFLYFCLLFPRVSKGILKPESTEEIIGQNFEVEVPNPETEVTFCFRKDEPQIVLILGTEYFEIVQDNTVGHSLIDENGNSYFRLGDATGCWEVRRQLPMKMRFINEYSDIQFSNYNEKVDRKLSTWRAHFIIFIIWIVSKVILDFLPDWLREESTNSETEEYSESEVCCTHCGSKFSEDSENCLHCGAPQDQKEE
ncbi:MAG: hypothetical protein XD87_0135 [candidate division WS6 bacterium 36_33]|uniref:Uncharacterized protein n=1 Tax=candidate division WS6 bacterium 36_33 TaxID=1641388 RepID=A0A101GZA3_9BACT|nr:MAG: hypothetical protein XD87_0135 [candidate division WS6 bacterium 36_33]